jgi:hypothetical protein
MKQASQIRRAKFIGMSAVALVLSLVLWTGNEGPRAAEPTTAAPGEGQSQECGLHRVSQGNESMHADGDDDVGVGCADCHGGDPAATTKEQAHVKARFPEVWKSTGIRND